MYNYGATLQAYALQTWLEANGHDVEIVDFRLPEHHRYELFHPHPGGRAYRVVKAFPPLRLLITPWKNRNMLKTWGRKAAFDKFDKSHLHLTTVTYHSSDALRKSQIDADMLIAGSDQIWNTDMGNGLTPAYFLDFGPEKARRISYAASFGVRVDDDAKKKFVSTMLRRFNSISVRERSGLDILSSLGFSGVQVCDPVFLLSAEEWRHNLTLGEEQGDYIFVYDFLHDDERIATLAKQLSGKTGLPLVSVNDYSFLPYADRQVNNAGPVEFLRLLAGARYVIASSFHATAFSIIFHKSFATFPLLTQRNSSRMTDLLDSINLSSRFQPASIDALLAPVDWQGVDMALKNITDFSKEFLKREMSCVCR